MGRSSLFIFVLTACCVFSFEFSYISGQGKQRNMDSLVLDLSIEDAEQVGLTNSVILRSLKDRKEIFRQLAVEKWRNYLPRVSIGYFGLKNVNENQPDSRFNDIRLQLNQLLYDGGETGLEIESAKLQEVLNSEDWNISRQKILTDIRKAYLGVLSQQDKEILMKTTMQKTLSQISDIIAESETGFVTNLNRFDGESKIRELELLLIKTESSKLQAEIDLKKNLNLPFDTILVTKESLLMDFKIYPPIFQEDVSDLARIRKPELKKSRVAIENLKNRKELAESYWKPKVSLGGYYGQNVNGPMPTKNEIYGFNVSVSTQLGSSTNQTTTNYGVQTDGSGIQRIPGFGPQFVGRGDNAFNSSTLNLFDDLSYSRKILEGKIGLSDAIRNHKALELELESEAIKSKERVMEAWQILRISNSKFYLALESWKAMTLKTQEGFVKRTDLLAAELDLIRSIDDLSSALSGYLYSVIELAQATGTNPEEWKFYEYKRGQGNNILALNFREELTRRGKNREPGNDYGKNKEKDDYKKFEELEIE